MPRRAPAPSDETEDPRFKPVACPDETWNAWTSGEDAAKGLKGGNAASRFPTTVFHMEIAPSPCETEAGYSPRTGIALGANNDLSQRCPPTYPF